MLATNAQRKPTRAFQPVLSAKPYEMRSIAILSSPDAAMVRGDHVVPEWMRAITFRSRSKVAELVQKGEMRWVGKHNNAACYVEKAAGTWQKTRSGLVCTMQLKIGLKGRHVPATQAEVIEFSEPAT